MLSIKITSRMKYNTQIKERGFTLIELLVVISIIGILSSVILTSLSSTKERAKLARYKSDLHQAELFLEMYNIEYGGYPVGTPPGALYCIAASSATQPCMIGGSDSGILNITAIGNTITAFIKTQQISQLAAIAAPKLKNDITFGTGSNEYRGIMYQSCNSPVTINSISVCPVTDVNATDNPKIIFPVQENNTIVIKIKVAGTNSLDNYSGGTQ